MSNSAKDKASSPVKAKHPIKKVIHAVTRLGLPTSPNSPNVESPLSSRSAPLLLYQDPSATVAENHSRLTCPKELSTPSADYRRRSTDINDPTASHPRSWSHYRLFERSAAFSPSPAELRRQSTCLELKGSRELVEHYETRKSLTLEQHGQFKHNKWGEDDFCDFDIDITDMDVSLMDAVKMHPITDSLAQCVQSYSDTLKRFTSRPPPTSKHTSHSKHQQGTTTSSSSESTSSFLSSPQHVTPNSTTTPGCRYVCSPVSSQTARSLPDDLSLVDLTPPVEKMAIPKRLQDALEFPLMVSRSAGQALEMCPKRYEDGMKMVGASSSSLSNHRIRCPRRLYRHREKRNSRHTTSDGQPASPNPRRQPNQDSDEHVPCNSSDSDTDIQRSCGPSDAFRVCPRRANRTTNQTTTCLGIHRRQK